MTALKFLETCVLEWNSPSSKVLKKTVVVKALSAVRGGAPWPQLLYEETPESIERRELHASQRKLQNNLAGPDHRPSKKDRRDIQSF